MLEHQKLILENVKFDKDLFSKELSKSVKWLSSQEITDLQNWCYKNFNDKYTDIIKKVFEEVAA